MATMMKKEAAIQKTSKTVMKNHKCVQGDGKSDVAERKKKTSAAV